MTRPLVYVAGPITGDPWGCVRKATDAARVVELPKACLPFDPRSECGQWDDTAGGARLWLLSPEQLAVVPDGTPLVSITGRVSIVGVDHIDTDTRGGWLSHGVLDAQIAEVDQ